MFKKVASMGFVAFFGFSLAANICSASIKDGNAPTKWTGYVPTEISDEYSNSNDVPPKNLVKKRHLHSKRSVKNSDNDFDYFLERKEEMEEQRKE